MQLSSLAQDIYQCLRKRVPSRADPSITYTDLVASLSSPPAGLDARDPRLADALGELVRLCREREWPAIAAIVVRAETRMPGLGYYPVAHPDVTDTHLQAIAWGNEFGNVKKHSYPPTL